VLTPQGKQLEREWAARAQAELRRWEREAPGGGPPPAPPGQGPAQPSYVVGLDLGQAQDYTALCVVERALRPDPRDAEAGPAPPERWVGFHGVRHLRRWKLGTPYSAIVADVAALAARPPLPGCPLVIDATGVGKAVVEMFRRAKLPAKVVPVTITAGLEAARSAAGWSVPKRDLVAVMQTLVQFRRFHVAPALAEAAALGREVRQFRVKVNLATGNESFEAWREKDHDDLVLAVALACWYGERPRRTLNVW
jgi:hypothetical protein